LPGGLRAKMRAFAFWLSVFPLFSAGSRSKSSNVTVTRVLNPVHPHAIPSKVHRRLLQHTRRANATSVAAADASTLATFGKPKKVSALSPAQEEAYLKGYVLQFVGLSTNGIEPRDNMDFHANRCMVSGKPDDTGSGKGGGGIGLKFDQCPHFVQKDKYGVPTGDAKKPTPDQMFQFMMDGRVRHVQTGKCLRRVKCGTDPGPLGPKRPMVYDLGMCDEKSTIKVQVWTARANLAAKTQGIGNALNGVEGPCLACGPFMMQQVCKGPCDMVEVTTGWTKLPAAYLIKKEKTEVDMLRFGPFEDGLCKSYVKDDEAMASWWYFHKYDIPK